MVVGKYPSEASSLDNDFVGWLSEDSPHVFDIRPEDVDDWETDTESSSLCDSDELKDEKKDCLTAASSRGSMAHACD